MIRLKVLMSSRCKSWLCSTSVPFSNVLFGIFPNIVEKFRILRVKYVK